jgi:hypothetical protein
VLSRLPRPIITVTGAVGLIWEVSGTAAAVVPSASVLDGGGVVPSHGGGGLLSWRAGEHSFAIPAVALHYLGQGLAPGLFDVAALARAEAGGRLPVAGTGPGRFVATCTAPAGALVTLRASARDAAGGSVTETITRGYAIANP